MGRHLVRNARSQDLARDPTQNAGFGDVAWDFFENIFLNKSFAKWSVLQLPSANVVLEVASSASSGLETVWCRFGPESRFCEMRAQKSWWIGKRACVNAACRCERDD